MIIVKKKKGIKIFIRDLLIILLAGLLITYFFVQNLQELFDSIVSTLIYSALIGLSLWKGNEYVSIQVDKYANWEHKPERKFLVGLVVMVIYTFLAIIAVNFIWHIIWEGGRVIDFQMPGFQEFIVLFGITFIISFALNIIEFIKEKQEVVRREERLKTEILKLEYEALKNQVNPHFLFNSLNALTSLVADNDEAVKFIKKLSDVYRYVLEQKDKEVVTLDKELEFVESYTYLHKIRFGNHFSITLHVNDLKKKVVPLSVQMLVENAIKHNVVSEDEPLNITINQIDDYLVVENNIQLKSMVKDSNKIGLENIRARYAYLTDKEFIIEQTVETFIVKVPLLMDGYATKI